MYKHVVFWKIKEFERGLFKTEIEQGIKNQLQSLMKSIPEIKSIEVGINIGNYNCSFFDICMIADFANEKEFFRYTKYPEHDKVISYIHSVTIDEQIVDYYI